MKQFRHLFLCGINAIGVFLMVAAIVMHMAAGTFTPVTGLWCVFWLFVNAGLFTWNLHQYNTDLK